MNRLLRPPLWVGLILLAVFAARLPGGWIGGLAYTQGRQHAGWGRYELAMPHLERAGVGFHRAAVLWLSGQVRLGLWHQRMADGADPIELVPLLEAAHRDYTEAITLSPASGWYRASLGDLHHQRERVRRLEEGESLERLTRGPWASVGRPGRLAIGFTREAIQREPYVYAFHDQLAFTLLDYGLTEEALAAVARSAEVQPIYGVHAYRALAPEPPELLAAFAEAAEGALGRTPYLRRVLHLIGLARLENRRGEFEAAERWARAALEEPGEAINRASAWFELGRALFGRQLWDEADAAFAESAAHPRVAPVALSMRSRVAEGRGELGQALDWLSEARRLRPRDPGLTLNFARIAIEAREWDRAAEAVRWARLVHPADPRAVALDFEVRLGRGDRSGAEQALAELVGVEGETARVRDLRGRLLRAGGR